MITNYLCARHKTMFHLAIAISIAAYLCGCSSNSPVAEVSPDRLPTNSIQASESETPTTDHPTLTLDPSVRATVVQSRDTDGSRDADRSSVTDSPRGIDNERMAIVKAAIERKRSEEGEVKSLDQPDEAYRFFAEQRLPEGETSIPIEDLMAAREQILAREQAQGLQAGAPQWQSLGPGNIGGRTRTLAIDQNNPDIMYAAGVAGGIWKTTDGGQSWRPVDDLMLNLSVSTIAIDPQDSNVLYAGTGEGVYPHPIFVRGLGIYKSIDAGETWSQLEGTVNGVPNGAFDYVNKVRISPNDSNRIYAATRFGVWRSLDAGATWSIVLSNPTYIQTPPTTQGCQVGCTDLAIRSDRNPDVLFAAFGNSQSDGLFRSDNGGDSWLQYGVPANQGRMTIAFAPSNNNIMYLLMADNGGGGGFGQLVQVFRSDNGGASFTAQVNLDSNFGPWLLSNLVLATGCIPGGTYSQGWYDNIISVDPADPDIVWVGGVDLFRSTDAGVNWELTGYWFYYLLDPPPPTYIHPDHHNIIFHPDYNGTSNQTMFVTNDGGIFRTQNARAAATIEDCPFPGDDPPPEIAWESMNNGYAVTQFYFGDAAQDNEVFIGGSQDNGTSRVQSGTTPNQWNIIFGGDGSYCAINPLDSQVMYVSYQFFPTIQKSVDGGETFEPAINGITDNDGLFITPMAMDQNNPEVLWSGGRRPWRTTNGAALWEVAGPNLNGPDQISAIAIAPSDSDVVYLGFDNGYVARSTNALDTNPTWTVISNGLPNGWVSSVAIDPLNPDIAYATYSDYNNTHVLRTLNGGQNWQSIDGIGFGGVPDIPVHWVTVRPNDSQELFVGTELGVFRSPNMGATWEPFNNGLAHTVVESLDWRGEDTLVAFTHGRGAFTIDLIPSSIAALVDIEIVTGELLAGELSDLSESDDSYVHTRSGFGETFVDLHHMEMIVSATTTVQSPTTLDVTIESRIDQPSGTAEIRLFNHNSQQFDAIGNHALGSTDAVHQFTGIDAADYVGANGDIEVSIRHIVVVPFFAFQFESWLDQVKIAVD